MPMLTLSSPDSLPIELLERLLFYSGCFVVLDVAGMGLTFFIAVRVVLCFRSVSKTGLVTPQCFG